MLNRPHGSTGHRGSVREDVRKSVRARLKQTAPTSDVWCRGGHSDIDAECAGVAAGGPRSHSVAPTSCVANCVFAPLAPQELETMPKPASGSRHCPAPRQWR